MKDFNNIITFDEDCKLWVLSIFNYIVDEDRIVVDADTLDPMRDNTGRVVHLDNFAGVYRKDGEIGFITADLYSLIQCLDDVIDYRGDPPKDE